MQIKKEPPKHVEVEPSFKAMEKFPATVVKLIGAVAQLSTMVYQLQATLAMMTMRLINLENDHYGDNY